MKKYEGMYHLTLQSVKFSFTDPPCLNNVVAKKLGSTTFFCDNFH